MKLVITIGLILIMLMHSGMKLALVANYQINKAYISANFCENKARPQMECNGKCFLAKQIKAQEESEKNIPTASNSLEEVILFCSELTISFITPTYSQNQPLATAYITANYNSPLESIFQPPQ